MIRRLRVKMIAIMMGVLVLVFAIVFLTLNIFMQSSTVRQTDHLLQSIAEQDGLPAPPAGSMPQREDAPAQFPAPDPDMMRMGRFFYVKVDAQGEVLEAYVERMYDFTREEALALAQTALAGSRDRGTASNMQFLIAEKPYGAIAVFAERGIQARMLTQLIEISLYVAGGTLVLLFGFSLLLSKWAVAPVASAFDRQRRFISDAGHELKTPLTIISANAEVLENEIGANTRLSYIQAQTRRMSLLVHDLLTLARADEREARPQMTELDLSNLVQKATLEFESSAFEAGRSLDYDIAAGIRCQGDASQLKRLVSILVDNAIKHSEPGGQVRVTLARAGERPRLAVRNTGPGISEADRARIFDRFYRGDASRARDTGGYGLGLAIAKSIVDAHRGRIAVAGVQGQWVEFTVTL